MERTLPSSKEDEALQELESFLLPRVAEAENGGYSSKTVDETFEEVRQEEQKSP